jgi:hypothetical protein
MATSTDKAVTRRTLGVHPRHNRRVIVTIGPRDFISFRLERERGEGASLPIIALYDQAERVRACASAGITTADISPCKNPARRGCV